MFRHLDEFEKKLKNRKKSFPENKDLDVEKEYEKEKQRLFEKGNKKIWITGKIIDDYEWKLIKKG